MTRPAQARTTDAWESLRLHTPARIGLGRTGNAISTREVLELGAAHAAARDAVHDPLDVGDLSTQLRRLGIGEPLVVTSAARSRPEYLRRPDLGRRPAAGLGKTETEHDLALVVVDGLSPRAVQLHAVPLLEALLTRIESLVVAPPTVAVQGRVALGDHVGAAHRARHVLVLVGERPGLSSTDSLGAYLTHSPRPGLSDSARNCVSNIRPPGGLSYDQASRTIADLLHRSRAMGATGVALKDESALGM
ncbi:MAG: ethanolamine ammonia-lyase subunit EutC [Nocardioidaceae bacterium]|nr:ethanolamine ammonia-lyase subunit EutC [Nocardioidaceae bacterium]